MKNILRYFSDQENSDEETLLQGKIRIAEISENKFVGVLQGNKVRSFPYENANLKVDKYCQTEQNTLRNLSTAYYNMDNNKEGKGDDFLQELMQFLNDEEEKLEVRPK